MAKTELTPEEQEGFDKCWAVYRKKAGKGQGMVTWAKHKFTQAQVREIFDAIVAQNRAGDEYCEKRFLRHFSTWLNDLGWKDEIPSVMEAKRTKAASTGLPEGYDARYQKAAEEYCTGLGLYIRGVTPKGEAKSNMAKFMSEKLGKRVLPYLSNYIK